jgi:hypothetical protein
MAYKKGLFKDGVPKPVGLLVLVWCLVPLMMVNGVYVTNLQDMTGNWGTMSEHITFANYASMAGMVAVYPLLLRIKGLLKSKDILVGSLLMQALLSLFCASVGYVPAVILGSFFIGFFKMMAMLEIIIPLMFVLSPQGDRARFYSVFYPISVVIGQAGAWLSAELAYHYQWQFMYYVVAAVLVVAIIAVMLSFHGDRTARKIPLYQVDWLSFTLFAAILMIFSYIFVYGKYEDWLHSPAIQGAAVVLPLLITWFVRRQLFRKRPFIDLTVLKYRNLRLALLLMLLMQLLYSSSNVQSAFTTTFLRLSPLDNMILNTRMIWGALLAGIFCLVWFKRGGGFKPVIVLGFTCLLVQYVMCYFLVAPQTNVEAFYIPLVLKGASLLLLYVGIGLLAADKMPMLNLLNGGMMLLVVRNIAGPVLFTAMYSNMLYTHGVQHLTDLAANIDMYNPQAVQAYGQVLKGAMFSGRVVEAPSIAAVTLNAKMQQQAILQSCKEIFGLGSILSVVIVGFALLVPMQEEKRKKWNQFKARFSRQQAATLVNLAE